MNEWSQRAEFWLCHRVGYSTALKLSLCFCSVAQSCLTLCDPMDYSLLGSSVHVISQARILEQVAISYSRGSSRPLG